MEENKEAAGKDSQLNTRKVPSLSMDEGELRMKAVENFEKRELSKSSSRRNSDATSPTSSPRSTSSPKALSVSIQEVSLPTLSSPRDSVIKEWNESSPETVKKIVKIQASIRGRRARKLLDSMKKQNKRRKLIVDEILSTEEAYVNSLKIIVEIFMIPLKGEGNLLPDDAHKAIFSNIDMIYRYNCVFYSQLKKRVDGMDTKTTKLGDIFLTISEYLKAYSAYVNTYQVGHMALLTYKQQSKELTKWLYERRTNPICENKDITDFLIMPVQRIPRYSMLLIDLVKHTWSTHPDFENLCKARDKISSIADFMNEQKRKFEGQSKVSNIFMNITGISGVMMINPTRTWVREGILTETDIKGERNSCYMFLFNDMLIWTFQKKDTFVMKRLAYLVDISIAIGSSEGKVAIGIGLENEYVMLVASNEEETSDWAQDLIVNQEGVIEEDAARPFEKRKTFQNEQVESKKGGFLGMFAQNKNAVSTTVKVRTNTVPIPPSFLEQKETKETPLSPRNLNSKETPLSPRGPLSPKPKEPEDSINAKKEKKEEKKEGKERKEKEKKEKKEKKLKDKEEEKKKSKEGSNPPPVASLPVPEQITPNNPSKKMVMAANDEMKERFSTMRLQNVGQTSPTFAPSFIKSSTITSGPKQIGAGVPNRMGMNAATNLFSKGKSSTVEDKPLEKKVVTPSSTSKSNIGPGLLESFQKPELPSSASSPNLLSKSASSPTNSYSMVSKTVVPNPPEKKQPLSPSSSFNSAVDPFVQLQIEVHKKIVHESDEEALSNKIYSEQARTRLVAWNAEANPAQSIRNWNPSGSFLNNSGERKVLSPSNSASNLMERTPPALISSQRNVPNVEKKTQFVTATPSAFNNQKPPQSVNQVTSPSSSALKPTPITRQPSGENQVANLNLNQNPTSPPPQSNSDRKSPAPTQLNNNNSNANATKQSVESKPVAPLVRQPSGETKPTILTRQPSGENQVANLNLNQNPTSPPAQSNNADRKLPAPVNTNDLRKSVETKPVATLTRQPSGENQAANLNLNQNPISPPAQSNNTDRKLPGAPRQSVETKPVNPVTRQPSGENQAANLNLSSSATNADRKLPSPTGAPRQSVETKPISPLARQPSGENLRNKATVSISTPSNNTNVNPVVTPNDTNTLPTNSTDRKLPTPLPRKSVETKPVNPTVHNSNSNAATSPPVAEEKRTWNSATPPVRPSGGSAAAVPTGNPLLTSQENPNNVRTRSTMGASIPPGSVAPVQPPKQGVNNQWAPTRPNVKPPPPPLPSAKPPPSVKSISSNGGVSLPKD